MALSMHMIALALDGSGSVQKIPSAATCNVLFVKSIKPPAGLGFYGDIMQENY